MKRLISHVILSPCPPGRRISAVAYWGSSEHHELPRCFAALSMTGVAP